MNYWKNYLFSGIGSIVILFFTFAIALMLSLIPLPYHLKWLMPNWLALSLIYWIIFIPGLIGVIFAFVLGIIIDLLLGNILGITSLCLVPVAFLADRLCYRFRAFNIWQQFLVVIVLVGISQLIKLWIQLYINQAPNNMFFWLVIPSSTIAWPFLCACLHLFRKVIRFC